MGWTWRLRWWLVLMAPRMRVLKSPVMREVRGLTEE